MRAGHGCDLLHKFRRSHLSVIVPSRHCQEVFVGIFEQGRSGRKVIEKVGRNLWRKGANTPIDTPLEGKKKSLDASSNKKVAIEQLIHLLSCQS